MSKLRVRAYNVLFGDAILVSVPERTAQGAEVVRHILIDVGNVLSGTGGQDTIFEPVIKDILHELGGRKVDLYVMTHEHMDHIQGLPFAAAKLPLLPPIKAEYAWLTASAADDYYDRFPEAKKKRLELHKAFDAIQRFLAASPESQSPWTRALLANNDPRKTEECVKHLRAVAPANNTTYVYRGCPLANRHPFTEAVLDIWAPEEDTSDYYGRFQPMALGVAAGEDAATPAAPVRPIPPSGVDGGAFFNLVDSRQRGWGDNLLTIDHAANNTSIVLSLTWRGWRLLFTGDAEVRSWKTMNKNGVLAPVHLLKIGHHGSHNGTPAIDLLDKILPSAVNDGRERRALLSTCLDCYGGVPHDPTIDGLKSRCSVLSVQSVAPGKFIDLEFEG